MFSVYILWSDKLSRFYIGQTDDLQKRVHRHNSGWELATKPGVPWKLVCSVEKRTRKEAMELERKLKNLSQKRLRNFIKK
ncbi:MAG: GIY-YIG nuclease family protein, partial [Chlorobi bacterium]|nr:GIY-YIG nuclease family protein [Chlorobiota bacterium]